MKIIAISNQKIFYFLPIIIIFNKRQFSSLPAIKNIITDNDLVHILIIIIY